MEDINKNCGIYKITSPSGKVYVGKSKNIKSRFYNYNKNILNAKNQRRLYNSFKKYGIEKHDFEIIEYCEVLDLYCRERHWQDFYDVLGNKGLNCLLTACEDHPLQMSEDTRKIRSELMSGENNPMYGRKGERHPAFGRKHTLEDIEKQRKSFRKNLTEDRLEIMSEKMMGSKNHMFGKEGLRGDKNPMYGIKGENHPSSELYINLETGIYYYTLNEAFGSYNACSRSMFIHYMYGSCLNVTNIVKVSDYEKGIARYCEVSTLKQVINLESNLIFKSIKEVSALFNIKESTLKGDIYRKKYKYRFMYLEDFNNLT